MRHLLAVNLHSLRIITLCVGVARRRHRSPDATLRKQQNPELAEVLLLVCVLVSGQLAISCNAITDRRYAITDRCYVITDRRYAITDRRYAITDRRYAITDRRYAITDRRYAITDRCYVNASPSALNFVITHYAIL